MIDLAAERRAYLARRAKEARARTPEKPRKRSEHMEYLKVGKQLKAARWDDYLPPADLTNGGPDKARRSI